MIFVNIATGTSQSLDLDPTNNVDTATGMALSGMCIDRPGDNP